MQTNLDAQLLREYAEQGREAAFAKLVSRHTDLVYSAALRQVASPDLARDVTQSVFIDLARKSPELARKADSGASLVGWLYRSTRFASLTLLRNDRRRESRETQAMHDFNPAPEVAPDWEMIRPSLDAAMAGLNDADRDALLLRFFKKQDYRTVGSALGVSENTAQQRVIRALEKLRKSLTRHGITTSSAALSAALAANAVQAAPVGLAATVSACAMLATPAIFISTPTVIAAAKTIAMTTLQKTLITATIAIALGTGIYEARQVSALRHNVRTLQEQQEPLLGLIQQLRMERDASTNQLGALSDAVARANNNTAELLRLRSEVGTLHLRTNELAKLLQDATVPKSTDQGAHGLTNFPRDSWAFAGLATPEDSIRSFMWAKSRGDVKTAFSTATPEMVQQVKERYFKGKSDEEISAMMAESASRQAGFQIMNKMTAADDQVIYQVHIDGMPDTSYSLLTMKKINGAWKVSNGEDRDAGN